MNRIKKWLEQNPQRILFIKIGLILLGIILLIAFPTLYLVLSGIGIWYFVKKVPDIRKRNLMIGLFVVSIFVVSFQTPTVTKKSSSSQSKTKQTAASTSSIASTNSTRDTSSSIEEAKRVEEERKAKEKAEEERKAKEKAEEERKAREKAEEEKRAKEKAANELQKKGEALVKQLEESQDMSQVKSAKEIVNQIENTDKKTELLDRIASVESFISQKEEEGRIAREAETRAKEQAEQAQKQQQAPTQSFYKNCKEARAAGVTPIYRGQPGYARHLDRDGDGIACE
ncbi:MAG: excalibur calcium-binding domain-containing protein [Fusobacterium periodonticum]|uniref:excalibur calcium-binding domain-containing protein n=2 Tax=Bacteria TaxID=2 RepID=UPI0009F60696|nr:excalibur calcium-binding domain-containing protein [Streptococcus timonensis]MBF1197502.1 excalibur calcium-binding domain-containing protein [Fusobacterium periodonticum]